MIGARAARLEDAALLAGRARFLDDVPVPALHAAFVRAPYARAGLLGIDLSAVLAAPGVVAAFDAAALGSVLASPRLPLAFPAGQLAATAMPPVLAIGEVRYVGEPVAIVVAETRALAEDAVDLALVDYAPRGAVATLEAAAAGAPAADEEPASLFKSFRIAYGDIDAAFADAAVVIAAELRPHRGLAHPIEGRGILVRPDGAAGEATIWASTQIAHGLKTDLAAALKIPEERLRVIAPEVGGGFGAKYMVYPEDVAVAAAAIRLNRAVKWVEDRREHSMSAIQERGQIWTLELAADADGRIRGVRGAMLHDQGAYAPHSVNVPYNAAVSLPGPYIVPAYALDVSVLRTNLPPVIPVRGAGYPQGCFAMERLLDKLARRLGLDRAEVRRRNLIGPERLPYATPMRTRAGSAIVYDEGDYPACQAEALARFDYAGALARRAAARGEGRLLGVGLAHALKGTGRGPFESARVRIAADGRVLAATGALAIGQGLKTALAQICAETLGVAHDQVEVVCGDTAAVALGHGAYASRQTVTAGSSILAAAQAVRAKIVAVAAEALGVEPDAIELANGVARAAGEPERAITFGRIADLLRGLPGYGFPTGVAPGLDETACVRLDSLAYANGFHICEVEVDAELGSVRVLRYLAVHDSGRLINPMLAEGQIHGGIAHGIGNALLERAVFDAAGQPLATTLAEYLLPTATDVPDLEVWFRQTPSSLNPLGVKGVGEAGVIPAIAAVISAVEHALEPYGVEIDAAPVDPVALRRLIRAGGGR